jgi:poly-gamma-glutamate synthase PgsB/CapB
MAPAPLRSPPRRAPSTTVELLEELLPPIQVRVRGHRLPELAERLSDLTDPTEFAGGERPGLRLASLATLMIRVVGQLQIELAALERRIKGHVEAYARARTDATRRARLELMIEETAPDPRSARADRQALRRHLDLDALRERYDARREQLVVGIELGLMIIGPAVERALAGAALDPSSSFACEPAIGLHSEVRTMLDQCEPAAFLLQQLGLVRRWPTRLAAVESLERVLIALGPSTVGGAGGYPGESPPRGIGRLRRSLRAIAMDRSEHEWVQARAIACLRQVDVEVARACVRERLGLDAHERPEWPKRDFLVRGLSIDQLCAHLDDPHDAALLCEAIEHGDPSEFVRIAHAKALEPLANARPAAFESFAAWLTRVARQDAGPAAEGPRVHAQACLAMVRGLAATRNVERRERLADVIVERLAATIVGVSHPLVARIACERAAIVCQLLADPGDFVSDLSASAALSFDPRGTISSGLGDHGDEDEQRAVARERRAARLVEALHACLADTTRSAAIHEAAAAALEDIDCALRSERDEWTRALRASVEEVPPGGRRRVPMPEHEGKRPDRAELARILSTLTRNDWGLDVDERAGRLLVRRGDRRVTRLWRVLHELRHPAGNKRQAFRHTTGRAYSGSLRAHPGRLDEVTATVVPGERLHLDAEGGWGRYLPLVDDLLGLPWLRGGSGRAVEIGSSHGVTTLRVRGGLFRRLRARWRLNFRYAGLSELRRRALMADEPSERRRYADELRERYGVYVDFRPHPSSVGERPVPARLQALFPTAVARPPGPESAALVIAAKTGANEGREVVEHPRAAPHASASLLPLSLAGSLSLAPPELPDLRDFAGDLARNNLHYFLTLEGNSQAGLGYFALGLIALFLGTGYMRRRRIATARAAIPLSIGGWGTRGKSGTERLKAGLFHGLGFRTFSKTTGCEAMFIHAAPLGPQVEIYTFRPYGKATIWEQSNLLELAAGLGSEVFLWECMALNPEYVDILQRGWMRDDFATITNTYPDHEDIQGPAGIDVATVIARFVPEGRLVLSSELGFNPVLREAAKERGAELLEIGDYEGDLLPDDLLGLFPYSEHPRNIALVTELARQLGIDDELAIVTMADYVYPDLGVLKFYPEVQVRGRTLSFVNGCSANERAGFLNNWKRTGCVDLAAAADPARMVITVVNNRDDRVSRSEVFSRILVNDVSVDAHVLIGTNLAGLQIFIDRALENFAAKQELVDPQALASGEVGRERARGRLRSLLRRVRAPVSDWWPQLQTLMRLGLAALGRRLDEQGPAAVAVRDHVARLRAGEGSLDFEAVVAKLASDKALNAALRQVHECSPEAPELILPHEVGRAADYDEFLTHLRDRIARMVIAGRLAAKLEPVLAARDGAALADFTARLTKAWTALFRGQLIVVWDAGATGDQIIDQCARAVPPGVHVTIMGTQNIKGTGLDFIYRWQALDAVCQGLAKLDSEDEQTRLEALRDLDAHSDFGFTDTGMLVERLPELEGGGAQEGSLRSALRDKAAKIHAEKLAKLDSGTSGAAAKGGKFWTWVEGWIDFMDGAVRYRQSRQLVDDLINFRVSHNKMAVEMREIYARAKGGWLGKALMAKLRLPGKRGRGSS